jgi:hypothetical protein
MVDVVTMLASELDAHPTDDQFTGQDAIGDGEVFTVLPQCPVLSLPQLRSHDERRPEGELWTFTMPTSRVYQGSEDDLPQIAAGRADTQGQ